MAHVTLDADCVIVLSFGYRKNEQGKRQAGTVNASLAVFAFSFDLPVLAQADLADALIHPPLAVIGEPVTNKYVDTWQVLKEAKEKMAELGYKQPLLVTHSSHFQRAKRQAKRLGLSVLTPKGLPSIWDSQSAQWWTRNKYLWSLHEALTIPYLKLAGKL